MSVKNVCIKSFTGIDNICTKCYGGGYCKTAKSLKAVLFSVLFLSFLLLNTTFISCAGGASGPKGSEPEGTALAIKLPDTSKTIYNKEEIVSFTVTVSSGSFTSTKSANKGETMLFSNLPVGTYSVKAYGKTSTGAVAARCETSVKIVAGETTTTTLHLARLEHWTVTFQNEGGSTISTQDISDGYKATKPANPAPSAGKAFSFWTADATVSDSSTPFDFNTPITGDTTLKPVFGVITYTVKYVSPVGSFTASDFTASTASSYSLPSTSSVTGLTFADWYADAAFTSSVDAASVSDVTTFTKKDDLHYEKSIYAKWTAKVQFKGEDISTGSMTALSSDVTVTYGGKVSNPGDPTVPTGATFGGWYTGTYNESTGKVTFGSEYDFNSAVTEDITLYAKWNFVMHKVTYISDPYEDPDIPETEFREIQGLSYGDMYPGYGYLEELGLYFMGWTDDENYTLSTAPTTSIPANTTEDVTLYAIWHAQVSFAVTGYSLQQIRYGDAVTKPADPTRDGATFGGWYKGTEDAVGNVTLAAEAYDFDDADANKVTTSFTLYPKWNATVTFNSMGGSAVTAQSVACGQKATAPTAPTKTGYPFRAWYTSEDGGTTLSDTAFDFDTAITENITLYAKWGFDISELSSYLASLPNGSMSNPNVLPAITGLTTSNWTDIKAALTANSTKFVDLSATTLPEGITDMRQGFEDCSNMVKSPSIPNGVTSLQYCFSGCTSLTTAPVIPTGVTNMCACFDTCTSLTTAPVIPDTVTNLWQGFHGCSSLTAAPSLPNSVTTLGHCFSGCTSLTAAPELPDNVSDIQSCFKDCTGITTAPVIPHRASGGIQMANTFSGCTNLRGDVIIKTSITVAHYFGNTFKDVTGISVYVPDEATKQNLINKHPDLSDAINIGEP